jgi:outer membrane protein
MLSLRKRAWRALFFAFLLSMVPGTAVWMATTTDAHAADAKIAVVDFQRAINEVKEGATAKAKLEGMFKEKKVAIEQMEADLRAKDEEYKKQAVILSDAARQQKEQELMQLQMQYQQVYMQSEQEMQQMYAVIMEGLISKMRDLAENIGKERGLTLIVEATEGGVVYFDTGLDITDELIKRYDAKAGG